MLLFYQKPLLVFNLNNSYINSAIGSIAPSFKAGIEIFVLMPPENLKKFIFILKLFQIFRGGYLVSIIDPALKVMPLS